MPSAAAAVAAPLARCVVVKTVQELLIVQIVQKLYALVVLFKALVVVVESLERKVGLMVDDVIAQQQMVIKRLDMGAEKARFFSGAAILSDGLVGVILDTDELSALAKSLARSTNNRRTQNANLGISTQGHHGDN